MAKKIPLVRRRQAASRAARRNRRCERGSPTSPTPPPSAAQRCTARAYRPSSKGGRKVLGGGGRPASESESLTPEQAGKVGSRDACRTAPFQRPDGIKNDNSCLHTNFFLKDVVKFQLVLSMVAFN